MLWSPDEFKELVSSHGFAQNEGKLVMWKYPSLNKIAELTGVVAITFEHWCALTVFVSSMAVILKKTVVNMI